jgi:hypothetical protein
MLISVMSRSTAAQNNMALNKLEREVITDSMLKIQSVQGSLDQIDAAKLQDIDEIHSCLKSASNSFRAALRTEASPQESPSKR